jgi:glycosyltransferase involved in cell wall biosynthesis
MSKNILELCLAHGLGGLEMFVAHCHKEFSQKGVCKVVVAPDTKLDHYLDDIEKFKIKRNKLFPFLPALKLAKYIDEHDIDIIHFHWTKDSITAVLAKVLSKKKPKLVQSRHMRMTRFKNDFYHRWLYKNIDMIHAVTKEVALQLEKFIPKEIQPKIKMVYLGVSVVPPNQNSVEKLRKKYKLKNSFIVGIIGRIEEEKGQWKVIEAVKQLEELDVKVLIIGSAMNENYLTTLKQSIQKSELENKVIFTGFTKEVNEHMSLCDTIVLATENETFGLVVIEAMANKKVVIARDKGGPLEIIDDEVDGLLFNGSVEDLSEKIKYLYNNREKRKSIEQNALHKVEKKFDEVTQLEKLYRELIA